MNKPSIAIKKNPTDYEGMARLGNTVIVSMTGNANFTTPVPSLVNLQAAVTAVEDALALWGDRHNHGSTAELSDLRQKTLTLRNLLKNEAQYVESTASLAAGLDYETMANIIDTSGFSRRGNNSPVGPLQAVSNFRKVITRYLYPNQVKLDWGKPENSGIAGNVNGYGVFRGTSQNFASAVQVAMVSKSTYLDTNNTGATVTWSYWIVPFNAAGPGLVSDDVTVTLLPA